MRTIITQMIDGYNIIVGFDQPVIDPEETKKIVERDIKKEIEFKELDTIVVRIEEIRKNIEDLKGEFEGIISHAKKRYMKNNPKNAPLQFDKKMIYEILEITEQEKLKRIENNIKNKIEEFNKIGEQKVVAMNNLAGKSKKLFLENPIYFKPRKGESIIDDNEFDKLKIIIDDNPGCKVDVDGNLIVNKKGIKYIKDGKIMEVGKLGEEPDGPLMTEVTPNQFEVMRIKYMAEQEKINEVNSIKESIAEQAAKMRSMLEIQGDNDALQKARDWYDAEVLNLKEKYGIE